MNWRMAARKKAGWIGRVSLRALKRATGENSPGRMPGLRVVGVSEICVICVIPACVGTVSVDEMKERRLASSPVYAVQKALHVFT